MAAISEHHIQQINEYFTCKIYPYENQPDSHPMKYPYKVQQRCLYIRGKHRLRGERSPQNYGIPMEAGMKITGTCDTEAKVTAMGQAENT